MVTRRPHGGDAPPGNLDFSASLNPLGPPDPIGDLLNNASDLRDYPYTSRTELRQRIASQHDLSPERILIGAGTSGLIQLLCSSLSGGKVTVPVPTFTEYEDLSEAFGWDVVTVNRLSFDDSVCLDQRFEVQDTDLLFFCNPNNPTGRTFERNRLIPLIDRCESENCTIVLDEAYLPLTNEPSEATLVNDVTNFDSLVVLRSFSKTYGMAGVRIGYLISSPGTVGYLKNRQNPWPVGRFALEAASRAVPLNEFVTRSRQFFNRQRETVRSKLRGIQGLQVLPSNTNYYLCRSTMVDIVDRLQRKSITVRNASTFSNLERGWFRFSLKPQSKTDVLTTSLHDLHD